MHEKKNVNLEIVTIFVVLLFSNHAMILHHIIILHIRFKNNYKFIIAAIAFMIRYVNFHKSIYKLLF